MRRSNDTGEFAFKSHMKSEMHKNTRAKTTVELEVNRLWHYPHLVLHNVEMEIFYDVEIVPVEMDSLNIVISP